MPNLKSNLKALTDTFNEAGTPFDAGCDPIQIEQYIQMSRVNAQSKPICVVEKWTWWDLEEADPSVNNAVIKSDSVIDDEAGRFRPGDWVRTSPLVIFHPPCLFETQNTVYLLVGPGTRKSVPVEQTMRFF